ncbi:MAG: DUF5069 domain-containing protein [Nitrospira sp.]
MKTGIENVQGLAKDLRHGYPRSPREKLGGYVIAARCVDKCRAFLLHMNGEYNYWPCSLAGQWFSFTGITPEQFKDVVATGATDEALATWVAGHSTVKDPDEVLKWNNVMRDTRLSDMSLQVQQYFEEYVPTFVPNHRPVYVWFDVYRSGGETAVTVRPTDAGGVVQTTRILEGGMIDNCMHSYEYYDEARNRTIGRDTKQMNQWRERHPVVFLLGWHAGRQHRPACPGLARSHTKRRD